MPSVTKKTLVIELRLTPLLTTQEDWEYILKQIQAYPTGTEHWVVGGNEYMEWTDLFLHPRAMDWLNEFLDTTDKNITLFTVGYTPANEINRLAEKYPGRINFELSVITLGSYRKRLMPHAPNSRPGFKNPGWSGSYLSQFLFVRARYHVCRCNQSLTG